MRVSINDTSRVWASRQTEQMTRETPKLDIPIPAWNLAAEKKEVTMDNERLMKAIDRAVKELQGPSTSIEMSFHDKTNELMIKVLNKDTGEVIREIPPEKWLDVVAKMREIAGILFDERV